MQIAVEVYEDGAAAVRTSNNGFIPFTNEPDARLFARGVRDGYNTAIYNSRRNGNPVGEMDSAELVERLSA